MYVCCVFVCLFKHLWKNTVVVIQHVKYNIFFFNLSSVVKERYIYAEY